jgi:hypothetical protein
MKGKSTMKKILLFLSIFAIVGLACDLSVTVEPSNSPAPLLTNTAGPVLVTPTQIPAVATPIPATLSLEATVTAPASSPQGVEVTVDPLSVVLPPGLTYGARGSQFPRADGQNVAPWGVTPGHTQLKLEGYLLQGKSHQPQIYVYSA